MTIHHDPAPMPDRQTIARAIEGLIDYLDQLDAPFEDLEDDNPDGCEAEDIPQFDQQRPGDPEDAEVTALERHHRQDRRPYIGPDDAELDGTERDATAHENHGLGLLSGAADDREWTAVEWGATFVQYPFWALYGPDDAEDGHDRERTTIEKHGRGFMAVDCHDDDEDGADEEAVQEAI